MEKEEEGGGGGGGGKTHLRMERVWDRAGQGGSRQKWTATFYNMVKN